MMYFKRLPENVLAYTIPNVMDANSKWDNLLVTVNTSDQPQSFLLPTDQDNNGQNWTVLADVNEASADGLGSIPGKSLILNPREVYILAIGR